mmetsp:Transcript_2266/g.6742  ORF Transcript_2266/g.6742 Transcript_2266/m.6742 type:complete len:186 (+) Transcript_2266:110-667(+)|eukprot:CAMPEP_0206139932 /NCGR_PEP_ID=MMETSP1473-20131121/7814_1 /ASSEMBLY_ACC=CAM_ASM_001109 /TAXON_ID=1461547 /ORGANISM="Stichococcus sp, Strain RCC1054" /LENGTH=185 /DNA_ID=CAMNT_0053533883 /DNA_START=50 /DNA_END=607 /DNA_ORIENTATION=+
MGDAETLKPLQVHSQDAEQPPTTETDVKTGTAKAALVEVGALSEVVEGEEGAGSDDLRACLFQLLQQKSPGQKITCHALDLLEGLLDSVLQRVLTEAVKPTQPDVSGETKSVPAAEPLTSLDIQRALRTLIPNEQLRPSLPAETKRCWHLDKKSLPGLSKRRKLAAAAAAEQHVPHGHVSAADVQ